MELAPKDITLDLPDLFMLQADLVVQSYGPYHISGTKEGPEGLQFYVMHN